MMFRVFVDDYMTLLSKINDELNEPVVIEPSFNNQKIQSLIQTDLSLNLVS